jgi:hypothetical protein
MKKLFFVLFVLGACVQCTFAVNGIDLSQYMSIQAAQCLKAQGYTFAVVRCYTEENQPDSNCAHSVANLWAAGFSHGMLRNKESCCCCSNSFLSLQSGHLHVSGCEIWQSKCSSSKLGQLCEPIWSQVWHGVDGH